MKTIKTRNRISGIKVLDKSANLSKRMKDAFVRTKERAGETQNPRHDSPAEYAAENIQSAAREIARNPAKPLQRAGENRNRARSRFRKVKSNPPKERRAAAEQAKNKAIKTRGNADKLQKSADRAGKTAKEAKSAVKDAKQTLKQVRRDGRRTLREVKQSARDEPTRAAKAGAGEMPHSGATAKAAPDTPKPENPAKRDFIGSRAQTQAESARPSGKTAAAPNKPTVSNPARGAANPGKPQNTPGSGSAGRADSPVRSGSRPSYMNAPPPPAKNAGNATQAIEKSEKAVKSTVKSAKETAKGTIKTAKKSVKTAEKSAKAAVKTAKQTAKAARKSAQATAKAAKIARRTARAAAKAAAHTAKAAAKAVTATVRAAIAAVKGLVAAVVAGGWIAVLIILIVCMIGLISGSAFGIFFSGEPSGDGGKTINGVIGEIDGEYQAQIDAIVGGNAHDLLDMSGARAAWKEVLAVYTVRTVSDPDNPMEVATVDDDKAAILRSVFWEMNAMTHSVETVDVKENVLDGAGNPTGATATVAKTVLRITVTHKIADEMAARYGFTPEQTTQLEELLNPEYHSLWNGLLYGITSVGDGSMIGVADTQIGNVGGAPYWSWYGFTSRVEWCACFVSWCAEQCGFIDAGVLPRFSSCEAGIGWFKDRGQWRERGYTPAPGDLIFFDWDADGISDHVGVVEKSDATTVYTIEGNTSDSVAKRSYAANNVKIMGYGLPVYP